jgi:hypothetical protein
MWECKEKLKVFHLTPQSALVERRYSSYSFSTSALDEGEWSASHHGHTLAPGKILPVSIVQEAGWAPEPVWTQRLEGKYFRLCRGSNLDRPVAQPVARHYTDWATRLNMWKGKKGEIFHVWSSSSVLDKIHKCGAKVADTYEGGRVLVCSAHLLSRALVSQSDSVACCTLSVSLFASHQSFFVPVSINTNVFFNHSEDTSLSQRPTRLLLRLRNNYCFVFR